MDVLIEWSVTVDVGRWIVPLPLATGKDIVIHSTIVMICL